jgi:serine/threonine protein kinase
VSDPTVTVLLQVRKTTMREVKILRMLRHPTIVSLLEAFRRKGKLVSLNRLLLSPSEHSFAHNLFPTP